MATKEFTLSDVAEHSSKDDVYMVVHDKVYDCTKFVDEHPGGEEVMLDLGGQDATEAFEDVGHSDEAREILNGLLVGTLKRAEGEAAPKTHTKKVDWATNPATPSAQPSPTWIFYYLAAIAIAVAAFAFWFDKNWEWALYGKAGMTRPRATPLEHWGVTESAVKTASSVVSSAISTASRAASGVKAEL